MQHFENTIHVEPPEWVKKEKEKSSHELNKWEMVKVEDHREYWYKFIVNFVRNKDMNDILTIPTDTIPMTD